jgi:hypothetical protein
MKKLARMPIMTSPVAMRIGYRIVEVITAFELDKLAV